MSVTKEDRVYKRWANCRLNHNKYYPTCFESTKKVLDILVITYILVTFFQNSYVENVIILFVVVH